MRETPKSPRRAIILADGHREAGLGHLSRSTAIAVALRCRGFDVACFAYGSEGPADRDGVSWIPFNPSAVRGGSVLVADSYELTLDKLLELAGTMPLVLLHDFGEHAPEAAMIVSPAHEAQDGGNRLVGLQYVALRPMFWGLPQRGLRDKVERILVTTGGGSLEAVGQTLAAELVDRMPEAHVALVRGPYGKLAPPRGVELVDSPDSLLRPLLGSDVAVTAGGQTMLEAASTGTPCVALPLVENQTRQARRLADEGAVWLAPIVPDDPSPAVAAVVELTGDRAARAALSQNGQQSIDGYGALRIAFEIGRLVESHP